MNESFILILMGFMGVAIHTLGKMKNLQDLSRSANKEFHWYRDYIKNDSIAIIMSVLAVIIWYFTWGEVSSKYGVVGDYKRISFVMAGMVGSFIIQWGADAFAQSARNKIKKYIDVKTNISDIVTNASRKDTLNEIIKKGENVTGTDVTRAPDATREQ